MGWKNILKDVVSTFKETVKELDPNKPGQPSQTVNRPSQPAPKPEPRYEEPVQRSDAEWVAYFREILQTEFAQYTVKENVQVTEVVGNVSDEFQLYRTRPRQAYKAEWGQPYSFVLYQDGDIKGMVMLGKGHSHDQNVKYLIARMYCKKLGRPYINFYTQMTNERNYVIGRIKKFGIG